MQSTLDDHPMDTAWQELSPLLDEAMAQLRDKDRDALVLRYFENKSLREVGDALGLQERAAQKRVARGLEKLHAFFARRGIASTTAIIAGGGFSEFDPGRAGRVDQIHYRRCGHEGRDRQRFNLNPHQRSIENHGMYKS